MFSTCMHVCKCMEFFQIHNVLCICFYVVTKCINEALEWFSAFYLIMFSSFTYVTNL